MSWLTVTSFFCIFIYLGNKEKLSKPKIVDLRKTSATKH